MVGRLPNSGGNFLPVWTGEFENTACKSCLEWYNGQE